MNVVPSGFATRLRAALLASRDRYGVRGEGAPSRRRSDGYEFAELRAYVAGDDPRRIDWAATARAGGLQTRVVYEDRALFLASLIDASGSMQVGRTRSNFDLAEDAVALWYGSAVADDRCARVTAERVMYPREARGQGAARICREVRETPGAALERALNAAVRVLPRGLHLLLVSDFYELEAQRKLLHELGHRFDVTALLARDPWHDGLPLGGFVRLRDAESGAVKRIYVGRRERERYRVAVARRETEVLEELRRMGMRTGTLDERGAQPSLAAALGIA